MKQPTRRQIIAGSLAAVGAAGAPAMAVAADPENRVRLAQQELRDATQAWWPDADIVECDWLLDDNPEVTPVFMVAVHRR